MEEERARRLEEVWNEGVDVEQCEVRVPAERVLVKSPGRERVVSRRAVGGNGGERKRIFEFSVVEATGCGGRVLARVDELQEPLAAVGVDRRVGAEIDAFRECAVRCNEHELSHEKWKNA